MSNINWIDATTSKPPIDMDDDFNRTHGYSKKVLVWVKSNNIVDSFSAFAAYINTDIFKGWVISGHMGNFTVTHYAEINRPI